MCSRVLLSLLLVSIAGGVLSASIKGGINGTKSGGWTPPKDWDWSVTPGRLIPVSEATDDLPTPGYRMSQLQQRIPAHHDHQPIPIMNVLLTQNESTPEEKVVIIGHSKPPVVNGVTNFTNDLQTQQQETTENLIQSSPKVYRQQSPLDEQELILLSEEPVVHHREAVSYNNPTITEKPEKVPVVEEPMVRVELPEICSITGLGCSDPKPDPHQTFQHSQIEERPEVLKQHEFVPHPEVVEHTEVVPHPEVVEHTEIVPHPEVVEHTEIVSHHEVVDHTELVPNHSEIVNKTEETLTTSVNLEQATEISSTNNQSTHEESTTYHDQLSSDSHRVDQQVVQQVLPEGFSNDHFDTQQGNNEASVSSNTTFLFGNGSDTVQELVTPVISQFNISTPTVVHSVMSSVSEYVGSNGASKHITETLEKSIFPSDISYTSSDQQQLQQEQQQVQLESFGQLPQEHKEHKIDEQKLSQIAESWGTPSISNLTIHSSESRIEGAEEKHKETIAEETVKQQEVAKQESVHVEHEKNVTEITELPTNSTGSSSIGDKIESYWKAATGYVSKALNF